MRNLFFKSALIALAFYASPAFGADVTSVWVNEQIDEINGYATKCHASQPPDVCNPEILRLLENVAKETRSSVKSLCGPESSPKATPCHKTAETLMAGFAQTRATLLELEAQLPDSSKSGLDKFTAHQASLLWEIESLKTLLPR